MGRVEDELNVDSELLKKKREAKLRLKEQKKRRLQQAVVTVGIRASTHIHAGGDFDQQGMDHNLEQLGLPQNEHQGFEGNLRQAVRLCKQAKLTPSEIAVRFLAAVNSEARAAGRALGDRTTAEDEAFLATLANAVELVFQESKQKTLAVNLQPRRIKPDW